MHIHHLVFFVDIRNRLSRYGYGLCPLQHIIHSYVLAVRHLFVSHGRVGDPTPPPKILTTTVHIYFNYCYGPVQVNQKVLLCMHLCFSSRNKGKVDSLAPLLLSSCPTCDIFPSSPFTSSNLFFLSLSFSFLSPRPLPFTRTAECEGKREIDGTLSPFFSLFFDFNKSTTTEKIRMDEWLSVE